MISPAKYDFTIYQGASLTLSFVWTRSGTGVDLNGYSGRCQFRTSIDDPVVAMELNTNDNTLNLSGSQGSIQMNGSAVQTAALTAKTYVYDLELTDPQGGVFRILKGTCVLEKAVTR